MKLTEIGELDSELLYVFLCGPGLGESLVVRVPPDHWAVVDSLRRHQPDGEQNPAVLLLERFHAVPDVVVLTHPHLDHADGLASVLGRRRPGTLVGCAPIFLDQGADLESPDAEAVWRTGAAGLALEAIRDIWEREETARLVLSAGATFALGPAVIEVLHPPHSEPATPVPPNYDRNRLSSPMLLRWQGAAVVLGADLPYREWQGIARTSGGRGDLAAAHGLKVSHHGSKTAQHPIAIGTPPPSQRFVGLTPFARGHGLPSFDDDHGVAQLLNVVELLHMTACRVPVDSDRIYTRNELKRATRRARFGEEMLVTYDEPLRGVETSWVAAAFEPSGVVAATWRGADAIRVADTTTASTRR